MPDSCDYSVKVVMCFCDKLRQAIYESNVGRKNNPFCEENLSKLGNRFPAREKEKIAGNWKIYVTWRRDDKCR